MSKPSPQISRLAKAFIDSLTASKLSDFLVWMLYHEFVQLPEDAEAWFDPISSADMRGWVALGKYLTASSTVLDTSHGFDIVVMDSICDRLGLQRSTVHGLLKQFADSEKMAYSQIARLVHDMEAEGRSYIEVLDGVHVRLCGILRMAARLKPTEESTFDVWHAIVMKRSREYLDLVIEPRIANIRSGAPIVTAATSDQAPQVVKDGIRLNYLFELMQQKRHIPTARYGKDETHTDHSVILATPPSSPPEFHAYSTPVPKDEGHSQLCRENQHLRAQLSALHQDMKHLQVTNDTLAHKLIILGHDPFSSPTAVSALSAMHAEDIHREVDTDDDACLHVPSHCEAAQARPRPRSLSYNAALALTSSLNIKTTYNHTRHRSEVFSWKYQDVFIALDPPSPNVRLSDPATGELLPRLPSSPDWEEGEEAGDLLRSASFDSPLRSSTRAATFAARAGRRSGMIFSKGQMDLLKAVRESTPRTLRDEDEFMKDTGGIYGSPPQNAM